MSLLSKAIAFVRGEPNWGELSRVSDDEVAQKTNEAPQQRSGELDVDRIKTFGSVLSPFQVGWTDQLQGSWTTQKAIEKGYSASTLVYLCVHTRATDVSRIPLKAVEVRGETRTPRPDSDVQRLLDAPNQFWTPQFFKYMWMAHKLLSGNAVIRADKSKLNQNRITEMWTLSPAGVTPLKHPTLYLVGYRYKYKPPGTHKQVTVDYDTDQIIHDMMPNPADPFWGISPLMAGCGTSVNNDINASQYQNGMLNRGARPSGALSVDCELEDGTRDQWIDAIKSQIEGPHNAGKVLLLDGHVNFTQMSLSPKEMDYLKSREFTREEILASYRVPPPVAGFYDNATYNNVITARQLYWENTVIPDVEALAQQHTRMIQSVYGKQWVVEPDLSKVEALLAQLKSKAEVANELHSLGYSANDINRLLDLGMPEIEETPNDQRTNLRLVKSNT